MNKIVLNIIRGAVLLGCFALVFTTTIIVVSVIGRHIEIPLPGSVEMVEMLIVVIGSTSLLIATFDNTHASAKLFVNRLSPLIRGYVEKVGNLLGAIFINALLVGTLWIVTDYWSTYEAIHLLGIPVIPFRLLFALSLFLVGVILLYRLLAKRKPITTQEAPHDT